MIKPTADSQTSLPEAVYHLFVHMQVTDKLLTISNFRNYVPEAMVDLWTACIRNGHTTDPATVPGVTEFSIYLIS